VTHVGLNMVFLVPGQTGGMEVAARALVPALVGAAPALRITAFVPREAAHVELGVDRIVVPVRSRNRSQWVRGEQQLLPRLARRVGCQLVHSLASTAPLRGPFARVVTIHDLDYLVVPEAHSGLRRLGMRALVPLAARRSHRVIAPSNTTRRDLVQRLGIAEDSVDTIPPGVDAVAAATPPADLRARLALGNRPVALSLSAKRPHKNLDALLRAHALIAVDRRPVLVLPGYPTAYEPVLRRLAHDLGTDGDVQFCGWLPRADIEGLLALARCVVMPSLYEGFGLPVLEAMARGTPVACSNRGSLPEVGGDAVLLFDPMEPAQIARAVERLLTDDAEAARLAAAGRARAAVFTWERTARLTLMSYERALAAAGSA
jgi:glycosyltransferase involved in cell wall biosynthesis